MDLEQATSRLRTGGRRVTAQRRAVLEALAELGCAQDVAQIYRRARRRRPGLGRVTVYRALDALLAEGLVHRVVFGDGRARFELHRQGRHHHHLVCVACGRVETMTGCAFSRLEGTVRRSGFTVTAHRLELFGYCGHCGDRATPRGG